MKNPSPLIKLLLPLILMALVVSKPFLYANSPIDKAFTNRISDIIQECSKLKAGTTRAELMKNFTTEGGLSSPEEQTFVYRSCPYIKVEVEFTLADLKDKEESPQDVIKTISKPFLEYSIQD